MEEKVELYGVKRSSSYKMPLVIIKEFETESVIKGYHAYMNDWTLDLRRKFINTSRTRK